MPYRHLGRRGFQLSHTHRPLGLEPLPPPSPPPRIFPPPVFVRRCWGGWAVWACPLSPPPRGRVVAAVCLGVGWWVGWWVWWVVRALALAACVGCGRARRCAASPFPPWGGFWAFVCPPRGLVGFPLPPRVWPPWWVVGAADRVFGHHRSHFGSRSPKPSPRICAWIEFCCSFLRLRIVEYYDDTVTGISMG